MARKKKKKQRGRSALSTKRMARAIGRGLKEASASATAGKKSFFSRLTGESRRRLQEVSGVAMAGSTLFLLLAFVSSYGGSHLCGSTGEALSQLFLGTFGYAAYLIVLCLGLWSMVLFFDLQRDSATIRGSGLLLCLVSASALIAHFFSGSAGAFPAGGVVGEFVNDRLMTGGGLGLIGTRIVLLVLTTITFILATDMHVAASVLTGARWLRQGSVAAAGVYKDRRLRNLSRREQAALLLETQRQRLLEEYGESDTQELEENLSEEDLAPFKVLEDEEGASIPESMLEEAAQEIEEEVAVEEMYEDEEEILLEAPEDDESEEEDLSEDDDPAVPLVTADSDEEPPDLNPDDGMEEVEACAPGRYIFPSANLLDDQETVDQDELDEILAEKTVVLEKTLLSFKVDAKSVEIQKGPVISMFEMELAPGIKVEKVRSLEDDLAIALRARTVRIVAPIPGKNTIGIEVPNPVRETVRFKPLLECSEYTENAFALPVFLGRNAAGRPMIVDLAKMPHLLVAGATGSGKSVCLNTIICSWLYTRTPEQVQLILIDPKMVELSQFENIPHLACPVVSDMKRAPGILEWAVTKMEDRYRLLSGAGVRNIYSYNKIGKEGLREKFGDAVDEEGFPVSMPFIVIVVDELADLMLVSAKEVESSITRLAAKSRAVGIHIILATQRPSTNVITGLIKANLPARIAFMVSSKIDSRVILDTNGAEQLLGQGDMLFLPPHSSNVVRGQCTFISDEEMTVVTDAVRGGGGPTYEPELIQRRSSSGKDPTTVDELYDAATRFIIDTQRGSASLLQRKFAIGYTRASRLIDLMAEEGVLGEYKGSQAREVQLSLDEWVALNPESREFEEGEEV